MKILLLPILVLLMIYGCSKNNKTGPCKADLIQFYDNGTLNGKLNYEYDDLGKIKKIISGNDIRTYSYFADSVLVTTTSLSSTAYILNGAGLAISSSWPNSPNPNGLQLDYTYTYDANGYLIATRQIFSQLYNGNIISDTDYTNYTVLDGNIIKVTSTDSYNANFEYSSEVLRYNTPFLTPFPSSEGSFLGKPPRNLLARMIDFSGNVLDRYSYDFGLGGKVLTMTTTRTGPPAGATNTTFHYQCD